MIGYFPDPYPDELVYSLLARYYAQSGYLGYVCAAEDIFLNTWNLPNIEFLNDYKPEVCQHLEKNKHGTYSNGTHRVAWLFHLARS